MDKSIEERAKEYAPDAFDPNYILPIREEYIVNQQRNAYIAGAREQKAIDEEVRLKKCDDMTPKECERDGFCRLVLQERKRNTNILRCY